MEKEKKQKTLKIVGYVALALAIVAIIVFCIVSAVYKDKLADLNDQNKQIEDLLDKNQSDSSLQPLDDVKSFVKNFSYFN